MFKLSNSPYEVIKIDENVFRIEESGVRVFLFIGVEKALLIDTGFGTGDIKKLVDSLTSLPLMLVNTHADRDHIGCNKLFEKAYMHTAEYDRYENLTETSPLWEGDIIDLGNRKFEIILIPGHTPGSIALLDRENRILIGGDSVQTGTIYMFSAGRNMNGYIDSMSKLSKIQNEFDIVYPSHGDIPVKSDIIPELIKGAERVLSGEIVGEKAPNNIPAKLYDADIVKFLCE